MKASFLPVHRRAAFAELLRGHGWDEPRAESAADGLGPVALHISGAGAQALEALTQWNLKMGLDLLTGDDWALIAGTAARLSALARPWTVPPELSELATAVGLALPAVVPAHWPTRRGTIPLQRPIIVGILLKAEAEAALLMVGTMAGVILATVLNNSGGAWDNAKKYIESGELKDDKGKVLGKGTLAHAAAVVGDTVGDPFKDTAGPSLHVLIKLLATITLVLAPLFV